MNECPKDISESTERSDESTERSTSLPEGYKLELETFGHEVVWLVYNINNPDIYIRSTEINLNYATALFLSELEKEKQYVIDKAVLMQKNIAQCDKYLNGSFSHIE